MSDLRYLEDMMLWEERHRYSLPKSELERRWSGLRKRMAEQNIEYLVAESQNRFVGGYFRYFTDLTGANYSIVAVFPLDGEMSLVVSGAPSVQSPREGMDSQRGVGLGVKQKLVVPRFPNTNQADPWYAEKAVEVMNQTKPKKIGMVGLGNMSASVHENIRRMMPNTQLVNASNLVEEMRMVKSEVELKLMRQAAYMHEKTWEFAKNLMKPGITAYEVVTASRYEQILVGSEEQQIGMVFGSLGGPRYRQSSWGNNIVRRPLKRGDVIRLLIESSAAGGYWYDMRRMMSMGPVPKEMQEAHDVVLEARRIMAENIKVGQKLGPALAASDNYLKSKGYPPEPRMGGHGQGLDLAERPIIHHDEPATVQEGMVIIPHPTAFGKKFDEEIGDNMLVTKAGAVPLYKSLFDTSWIDVVG
ncbi:MAG: M24 family metallopeptidase [archaeon]